MGAAVLDKGKFYERIGYAPHAGQRELHFTPRRFKVVPCGRRWGKTIFGAREAEPNIYVPCPITGEPQLGWIVGPQYTDAEKEFKVVYNSLRALGVDRDCIRFVNNRENGSMHIKTRWGFELVGKSAQHPETLVGDGLNFVLMVEAGRHKRRTWGEYIRPALSDRRGWAVFTGVPEGKSETSLLYALYQRGMSERFPSWGAWRRPSWTNTIVFPGGRQDPEILEAESDLTADEFGRQYGAEFNDKVGAVMQEWDDDVHLADLDYEPSWPLYLGVDYGFVDPFVVLFIQEGPRGEIRVIKERRYQGMDTYEVCQDLIATEGGLIRAARTIYPEPAEPDDTRTMQRMLRIPAVKNTGGPLKTRLALIRRALKYTDSQLPRMLVDRSCKWLAWEMREGYRWPERKTEVMRDTENPVDRDNHGPEALGRFFRGRYGALGLAQTGSFVTTARMG